MDLVERESALETLNERLALVAASGGHAVAIAGEAGVGKTALLKAFAGRSTGADLWWGNCDALEAPLGGKHATLHRRTDLCRRPAHSDERPRRKGVRVGHGNAKSGVTWVHSYVSEDLRKTYCVYDGPTPEAIRETAESNNLPIDRIIAVSVLDPYFYRS